MFTALFTHLFFFVPKKPNRIYATIAFDAMMMNKRNTPKNAKYQKNSGKGKRGNA